MSGLLLCDDLIFASRITGTARALGLEMKSARSVAVLKAQCEAQAPSCVLVDLANPGFVLDELMAWLKTNGSPRVVAYGSHVDTESLRQARAAGCDPVLPRSKFVEELPVKLREWMGG